MKNVLTIIKKEFARFFKDKRLVIGTLLLPGILIFVLYTLLGSAFYDENKTYTVAIANPSEAVAEILKADGGTAFAVTEVSASDAESVKEEVRQGKIDLFVLLPENFDALLASGTYAPPGQAPNVEIWYDSASTSSSSAFSAMSAIFDALEDSVSNRFDVNLLAGGNLSSAEEATASYYAMLLPFLILTFLYSGCMGIAPESIAGEKERGTIATLLVTPIKRSELVVGKILSLSVLSTLSAVSSFIGTFLSMPKLMGGSIGDALSSYTFGQYVALFFVMISAVLLIVALISILSSFAKSVKEATTLAVPLMILIMLIGLSSMLFHVGANSHAAFLIPIYNCVQVMSQIFSLQFSIVNLLITLASNLVYIVLLVFLLQKMFQSEKVLFNK